MTSLYHLTQPELFQTLRSTHQGARVAFWQPTPKHPRKIASGERWYFKEAGRPLILGFGLYSGWEKISPAALFDKYGSRSGSPTLEGLIQALRKHKPSISPNTGVGNVVLDNFTAFNRPLPLNELGLKDLNVSMEYLSEGDPVAPYVASLATGHGTEGGEERISSSDIPSDAPAVSQPGPTVGPVPSEWRGEVSRSSDGEALTYAIRFGSYDIWKVGWTKNVSKRLREINAHIPSEILNADWKVEFQQKWNGAEKAYEMEQKVLAELTDKRTQGERLKCSESEFLSGWLRALGR